MSLTVVDYCSPGAQQALTHSLRECGFGVLKNHPLPLLDIQHIYQQWALFFNSSEKHKYVFDPQHMDGFFPSSVSETAKGCTLKDLKEYFHYYPWGRCPASLKPALAQYQQQACALAAELLAWIEQATPATVADHYRMPLSAMITNSQQTLLRVLHYPPLPADIANSGALRAAAHEDINLLTVLPAANEPGLQVKTKSGEWLDVPCDSDLLIVNTGDMLQEVSDGYFPSTTHRVINPVAGASSKDKSRISLPLFLHPRPEVVLSNRHTASSYLQERLRELGLK